jgi:hypothetical protein
LHRADAAQARAEIDVIGRRASTAFPDTHERLRAQVHLYTRPTLGMDNPQDVEGADDPAAYDAPADPDLRECRRPDLRTYHPAW